MKWIGISGTWRTTDEAVEERVRASVRDILKRGHGIVAGGAMGVDFFATDEALKIAPDASRVKIALPTTLDSYLEHLKDWADGFDTGDGAVQRQAVEDVTKQLRYIQATNPVAIVEGPPIAAHDLTQNDYYARDTVVAQMSCELVAFQINKSKGTQDTINKAANAGKAITIFSFTRTSDKTYGALTPPKPAA